MREIINQNEAELVALVLENLPGVFSQSRIAEKDKEAQTREKETENPCFEQEN